MESPAFAFAASFGEITGTVTDAFTGKPVIDAIVKSNSGSSSLSSPPDGAYTIISKLGKCRITVEAGGYCTMTFEVTVREEGETIKLDIILTPLTDILKGDINGDRELGLTDTIIALQITADITPECLIQTLCADVNGDNRIGPEDAVYVIQQIAEHISE